MKNRGACEQKWMRFGGWGGNGDGGRVMQATTEFQGEVLKRLDALAQKFGATGEHLWTILVRQAYVEAAEDLCAAFTLFGAVAILLWLTRKCLKKSEDDRWNDVEWNFAAALCAIAAMICFLVGIANLYETLTPLLNPEFFALHEIWGK
jgi:hypothetical protein